MYRPNGGKDLCVQNNLLSRMLHAVVPFAASWTPFHHYEATAISSEGHRWRGLLTMSCPLSAHQRTQLPSSESFQMSPDSSHISITIACPRGNYSSIPTHSPGLLYLPCSSSPAFPRAHWPLASTRSWCCLFLISIPNVIHALLLSDICDTRVVKRWSAPCCWVQLCHIRNLRRLVETRPLGR